MCWVLCSLHSHAMFYYRCRFLASCCKRHWQYMCLLVMKSPILSSVPPNHVVCSQFSLTISTILQLGVVGLFPDYSWCTIATAPDYLSCVLIGSTSLVATCFDSTFRLLEGKEQIKRNCLSGALKVVCWSAPLDMFTWMCCPSVM